MAIDASGTIVITGASQGIGREISVQLSRDYENPLFLVARNKDKLEETKNLCKEVGNQDVTIFVCDLTNEAEVLQLSNKLSHLKIVALVNNAGAYLEKKTELSSISEYYDMISINALAPIMLTNNLLPTLRNSEEIKILFISSVTAKKGQARCGAYSVGKSALQGYIESLRESLLDTNISVTSIILGQTFSTSWEGSTIDPKRLIDPVDVGRTASYIFGLNKQTCVEELIIKPQKGDLP